MKELNFNQVQEVNGAAGWEYDYFRWLTNGSGYAASNLARATAFTGSLGLITGAFSAGYTAGSWLNDRFDLGSKIGGWAFDVLN